MNSGDEGATSCPPEDSFYEKYMQVVERTLKECEADFKDCQKFSDECLMRLYHVFGGIFERALDLFEQGRVTFIVASNAPAAESLQDKNARYLIQIKGHSGELYTLFPDINYCTCPAFRIRVLGDKSQVTCKHVLAAWLVSLDKSRVANHQRNTKDYQLVAKLRSIKTIIQLLKAINFREFATCILSENGLRVTVEDEKCMQASAYIPSNVFEDYKLKEDAIFKINLTVLVECLSMSWTSKSAGSGLATFQLLYETKGSPITILIEEEGIITECHLKNRDPDELLDFQLEPDSVVNKVVLNTELLKDVLSDLDTTSDIVLLVLSPSAPFFRISTEGLAGICHIDIQHDGDLIDSFECTLTATTGYKLNHIKPAVKALSCANKVSLRTDRCGLLCFQFMAKTDEGHTCYIEYYVSPVIEPED